MTADNPAARVDLDALAGLLEAATLGPWRVFADEFAYLDSGPGSNLIANGSITSHADAALIAAAVNALPDLLTEVGYAEQVEVAPEDHPPTVRPARGVFERMDGK